MSSLINVILELDFSLLALLLAAYVVLLHRFRSTVEIKLQSSLSEIRF